LRTTTALSVSAACSVAVEKVPTQTWLRASSSRMSVSVSISIEVPGKRACTLSGAWRDWDGCGRRTIVASGTAAVTASTAAV